MKDVIVLFGGNAPEHDISIITGVLTANSVDKSKFNVVPVYIAKSGKWYTSAQLFDIEFFKNVDLKKLKQVVFIAGDNTLYFVKNKKLVPYKSIACAINACHGGIFEGGALSSFLQLCNVPIASPNAFSAQVAMDKSLTKTVLNALGIKTVQSVSLNRTDFFASKETCMLDVINSLGYPVIVKPATLGSSIGVSVAQNFAELESAIATAFNFDSLAIVEKYIAGCKDINVAVYDGGNQVVVSECEMPQTKNSILSFQDKYLGGKSGTESQFPAPLTTVVSQKIKQIAKTTYERLGFQGIVRFDFLVDKTKVYLNEINAVPGSMAYYLFCNKISEFTDLLTALLNFSMQNHSQKTAVSTTYRCPEILNSLCGAKGCGKLKTVYKR